MRRRLLPVAAAAIAAALSAAAPAGGGDEQEIDEAGLAEVRRAMDAEPLFAAAHEACPADLFETQRPFWRGMMRDRRVRMAACEADAMGCYRRCVEARSGNACFALARAMQGNLAHDLGRYWEMLFAHACAIGHAGGCTNRGGGIRNGGYDDEPFDTVDGESRRQCLFRTFKTACAREDAWGCAMHGQSYHYGEGVARDTGEARRHYQRSCAIDPDFASCEFARRRIAEIEDRPFYDDDGTIEH